MDAIKKIVGMLSEESAPRRIAAAIVLAELKPDSREAVDALCRMAAEPLDALSVPAIEALGSIGSARALPVLFEALERGGDPSTAARKAIAATGNEAVAAIRERLETATPAQRARLSEVLASVGGKRSFDALLKGLYESDPASLQRTTLAVRHEIKDATARDRAGMLEQLLKFLEARRTQESEPATRAALKLLGYLELTEAIPTLLAFTAEGHPPLVRTEAVTALRFPMSQAALSQAATSRGQGEGGGKALSRIVDLLEDREHLVRRCARETLAVVPMPKTATPELLRLALGRDAEVARFAIARLGDLGTEDAVKALAQMVGAKERDRVQESARALLKLKGGPAAIATALARTSDEALARLLAESLAPRAQELDRRQVRALLEAAGEQVERSPILARHLLEPVALADPEAWAEALRAQATKLSRKSPDRALPLLAALCRSREATHADRFAWSKMLLARSALDAHPSARQKDPALEELARLAEDGFDLVKALAREKALGDEARFYVGFDFVERQSAEARDAGAALLEALAAKGARTKLGKAAKNKLALSGLSQRERAPVRRAGSRA